MLKLIVVPLDGSGFGEQAIPTAIRLAERERAEVELVHVHETLPPYLVQGASPLDPRLDEDLSKERGSYLHTIAEELRRSTSASVRTPVLEGAATAAVLAEYIARRQADLVVMATHGHGGLSRLWLGSVSSELVRHSSAPVLLIRPTEGGSRTQPAPPFQRVLIPLDGSPASEEAIDHAMAVAAEPDVEFLLLHVIIPIGYIAEPADVAFVHERELEAAAATYLGEVADRIRARGYPADIRVLNQPQPVRAILECADESGAELIAMETHGRSGVTRLVMGSVADKVVRASRLPVLLHQPRVGTAPLVTPPAGEQRASGPARS
ncbi:MAG TPA: universal stress protein [Gemmatimonadaceae bacterium]|nr:universal stress protein [Gemmatimonadaceae bacterium]